MNDGGKQTQRQIGMRKVNTLIQFGPEDET